jgi:hypothetical protein
MTDYVKVLTVLYPNAEFVIYDNDYDTLVWHSDGGKPSREVLDAAWPLPDARESALAKLQALGLTEQEALALVGSV